MKLKIKDFSRQHLEPMKEQKKLLHFSASYFFFFVKFLKGSIHKWVYLDFSIIFQWKAHIKYAKSRSAHFSAQNTKDFRIPTFITTW